MRICDYTKLALRTESEASTEDRMVHAALGMASEIDELLEGGNYLEEIGDFSWYFNVACNIEGTDIDELEHEAYEPDLEPIISLVKLTGKYCDLIKRKKFYRKDYDRDVMIEILTKIKCEIFELCNMEDLDYEEVLEKNILKLEKRYPDLRFNEDHAVNRNLQKEKEVLDG